MFPSMSINSVCAPSVSHSHPCLSRRLSETSRLVWPRLPSIAAFPLGPCVLKTLYVPFRSKVSISPSPTGLLTVCPVHSSKPDVQGTHHPSAGLQAEESDMGLRTFTPVRKLHLHSSLEVFLGEISNRYAGHRNVVMSNHSKHWRRRGWVLGSRAGFVINSMSRLIQTLRNQVPEHPEMLVSSTAF